MPENITIFIIRKNKGRRYSSEKIVPLLLEELGISGMLFRHGPSGEPLLESSGEEKLPGCTEKTPCISVSDTKNYWSAAFANGGALGLDIEEQQRTVKAITAKKLHPLEQKYLAGLQPDSTEWKLEFLDIWTRKEAYSKYCAAGLSIGFAKFSVIGDALEYRKNVSCGSRPEGRLLTLSLPQGLTGSLCTSPEEENAGVICRRFAYEGEAAVSAVSAAGEMLAVRNMSRAELTEKLTKKGYTKEEASAAADELEQRGYIDEEEYARRQALLLAKEGKGAQRIRQELSKKGIRGELAAAAIDLAAQESGTDEYERALHQAEKLFPGGLPEFEGSEDEIRMKREKALAKIARRLASQGYPAGIVYRVLDRYRQ